MQLGAVRVVPITHSTEWPGKAAMAAPRAIIIIVLG